MVNISIYTLGFNLQKNQYPWREALDNFLDFLNEDGDQLVIALDKNLNDKDDETFSLIKDYKESSPSGEKIKIVETAEEITDPLAIGNIKEAGLRACDNEVCLQLDLDERVAPRDRYKFDKYARLLAVPQFNVRSFFIPVLNLFQDYEKAYDISAKWYLHKKQGCHRGSVNFAKLPDGSIDIEKSDACELIDANGNLVSTISLLPTHNGCYKNLAAKIKEHQCPIVYHLGYALGETRASTNKFFNNHLCHFSNYTPKPETTEEIFASKEFFEHGLPLWN